MYGRNLSDKVLKHKSRNFQIEIVGCYSDPGDWGVDTLKYFRLNITIFFLVYFDQL